MEIKVSEEIKQEFEKLRDATKLLADEYKKVDMLYKATHAFKEALWEKCYEKYPELPKDKNLRFDDTLCAIVSMPEGEVENEENKEDNQAKETSEEKA